MKTLIQTLFFCLLVTQISIAQWVQLGLNDKSIKDITARNSHIFAITSDSAVYRSTDNGITWLQIIGSLATGIEVAPSESIFMIRGDSLFRSSDNGNTWDNITEQLPSLHGKWPTKVTVSPVGFIFCQIIDAGMYFSVPTIALSTDDGMTWTSTGDTIYGGDLFDFRGSCAITYGQKRVWPHWWDYIYLSSDNGQAWSFLGNPISEYYVENNVLSMCLNGNIILGGWDYNSPGLFLSSDSCSTWTEVSTLIPETGLSIESGGMLAGTDSLGVILFSDNGDSLGSFNEGLSDLNTHILSRDNNGYIYLGTSNGVWRRRLSEITSVEELSNNLPLSFNLSQNYPNPFNPSTTFSYSIPNESKVIIEVYDVLGKEIETLVNEEKSSGTYELTWNAANLPSGVYFYQLKAGDFIKSRKMVLIK